MEWTTWLSSNLSVTKFYYLYMWEEEWGAEKRGKEW